MGGCIPHAKCRLSLSCKVFIPGNGILRTGIDKAENVEVGERPVRKNIGLLREILHYELESAERYRRFVSIVMVSDSRGTESVDHLLSEKVRYCDVLASAETSAIIMMSETSSVGAQAAIERYKRDVHDSADFRFSLVTFPYDARGVDGLIDMGSRRLQKAVESAPGTVVAAD